MAAGDKRNLNELIGDYGSVVEEAGGLTLQRVVVETNPNGAGISGSSGLSTGKVTAGAAATLVIARPTRRSLIVTNTDAALDVYIGAATVSASTGYLLQAGKSVPLTWTGLVQVFAASGSPVVTYWDEYD